MELVNKINTLLDNLADKETFSGTVLLHKGKDVLMSRPFGYANRGWKIKNTADTRFRVASITKMFTAFSILELIDEGQFCLKTSAVKYLELKDTKIPEEVTVYHLLTHTSGIGDYFDETNSEEGDWEKLWREKPIYNMRNLSDYYSMFSGKEPVSSPGGQFCYNGAGYILLGMMIEKASGLSYFDYIRKHVFEKFSMRDSDFLSLDVVSENTAEGYEPIEDRDGNITGWRTNIYNTTPEAASDGGSSSSAFDLAKFINVLKGAKELSLVEKMLSRQVLIGGPNGPNNIYVHYGFGCFIYSDKNNRIIRWGHTGEEAGVSCRLFYYPALDIDVIVLGNRGGCAGPLFMSINDILFEEMQK